MAIEYRPELPEGFAPGLKISVDHPDYRKLEALAREEGWTQKSFSRVLGLEASRVLAHQATKPAPPDYSRMSTSQKLHLALQQSDARREAAKKE